MKRILVTGGAGFVGSHLCEKLLSFGDEIICLDSLQTGDKKNIQHLLENENFSFIQGDITDATIFREVGKVDQIYNLACPASPVHYQTDPVRTVLANTLGVINVLDLARSCNARILQTSTSEVYGDPLVHPQTEDYRGNVSPIGPRACYDEGKRVAETLFFDYHRQYGVEIRVVRIFNTYGPRLAEGDGRVISNFIVQALRGEDLTIFGTGEQTRSLCFVSDTVAGLIKMMNKDGFTGPVNIGNPHEQTIKEIAEKIIELTGTQSKLIYKDLPKDDPKKRKPDITLAKKELGWEPQVVVEDGLNQTIQYFKNR